MPVRDDKNGDGWGGVSRVGGDHKNRDGAASMTLLLIPHRAGRG